MSISKKWQISQFESLKKPWLVSGYSMCIVIKEKNVNSMLDHANMDNKNVPPHLN